MDKIVYSTYIKATPARVFRHFTSGEGMDAWFTCGAQIEAKPGGKMHFRWVSFGAKRETSEDQGEVIEVLPDRRFVFTWQPGDSITTVSIDFKAHADGCMVELCESGYGESERDRRMLLYCACGWGEALTLLKFYLEHGVTYGVVPEVAEQCGGQSAL